MRWLKVLWIVLFRFRPVPRVWAIALVLVNAAALAFIDTIHGRIALAAAAAGIVVMAAIYTRLGFVRLLGVGHVFWIPMLAWFAANFPDRAAEPALFWWAVALVACNAVSLVIDAVDLVRFLGGERAPYYVWNPSDGD